MKIVFWGTPKYAQESLNLLIKHGYNITAVVTQPDKRRGRGSKKIACPVKTMAEELRIPVYCPKNIKKDLDVKQEILGIEADVYIVVAFGQILPQDILDKPGLGCWNSHASLLPKWRGAAPIQWSLLKGDKETGINIMNMEAGLDTGPIIRERVIKIENHDNLETLTNKLSIISGELLIESLSDIQKTIGLSKAQRLKNLNSINQNERSNEPSYARQIQKTDYLIDWQTNTKDLCNKIRALYPNCYTLFNNKRIKIVEAKIIDKNSINGELILYKELLSMGNKTQCVDGQIVAIKEKNGIIVKSNSNYILIKKGQMEGRKLTDALTLSMQAKLKKGDILGL